MGDSDWDSTVKIGYRANQKAGIARTNAELNAARRSGDLLSTEKKFSAGANTQRTNTEGQKMAKLDRENEIAPPPKLDKEIGKTIAKFRLEKGMNQKDFAAKINEKANVVNDYEQGRVIPSQQLLAKMERILGVKLRGANAGQPFGKK